MSVLILSESMTTKLASAESPIELCAANGLVLGYFTPAKSKSLNLDPGISDAEMLSRVSAGGDRPLADIIRELEAAA